MPCGQSTCQAKNSARFRITPTTAAVMPVSGALNLRSPWVVSMNGAPMKMKTNEGRKVKNVATSAPATPAPRKPTKATTMMSGPGVVSPSARPSIICGAVSQP